MSPTSRYLTTYHASRDSCLQVGAAAGISHDADDDSPWSIRLLDAAPDAAPHLEALMAALEGRGGTVTGSQGSSGDREDADMLWAFEPQHLPAVQQLTPGRLLNHIPGGALQRATPAAPLVAVSRMHSFLSAYAASSCVHSHPEPASTGGPSIRVLPAHEGVSVLSVSEQCSVDEL
jgi:hypothetical protein